MHEDKTHIYRENVIGQCHENGMESFSHTREHAVEEVASSAQKVFVWRECSLAKLPAKWGWVHAVQKSLCTCTKEYSNAVRTARAYWWGNLNGHFKLALAE